ncbi:MAG: hypothetical protein ISS45_05510 [Candidatus Omnitrophica bacterium]|nr:hypothetical protein [Candidatus Omnitrophota bacterium]
MNEALILILIFGFFIIFYISNIRKEVKSLRHIAIVSGARLTVHNDESWKKVHKEIEKLEGVKLEWNVIFLTKKIICAPLVVVCKVVKIEKLEYKTYGEYFWYFPHGYYYVLPHLNELELINSNQKLEKEILPKIKKLSLDTKSKVNEKGTVLF